MNFRKFFENCEFRLIRYIFHHILFIISTYDLEIFTKLPIPHGQYNVKIRGS